MATPRPLSPSLQDVVDCLAAIPYEWYVRPDGKLRSRENGTEMCVLTAVARYRTGRLYSIGDWIHAGECLGLSPTAAGLIVEASDRRAGSRGAERLRRRLLAAATEAQRLFVRSSADLRPRASFSASSFAQKCM